MTGDPGVGDAHRGSRAGWRASGRWSAKRTDVGGTPGASHVTRQAPTSPALTLTNPGPTRVGSCPESTTSEAAWSANQPGWSSTSGTVAIAL
jgi:hypothetical protein